MLIYNNKFGYSIIIAIIVMGFLFAITGAVFKIVLVELNDNRGMYNYLKAYYAVEGAGELAMLELKEKGYGYYRRFDLNKNDSFSNILNSTGTFNPIISYDIGTKTSFYTGELAPLSYDVIPLFYKDDASNYPVLEITSSLISGDVGNFTWNIVSDNGGLSSVGGFNGSSLGTYKYLDSSNNFVVDMKSVKMFLTDNSSKFNYLVLFNSSTITSIKYNLDSNGTFFSRPRTDITVSAKIGNYKQNISIKYDNTDYLGIYKYAIYDD
ncbi:MAG: hypothetical protein PHN31_00205 [Candidatus Gracilibacteria bacterium]|nr:hypothetical protein [Candidatus Gracilibacteria bacterium]